MKQLNFRQGIIHSTLKRQGSATLTQLTEEIMKAENKAVLSENSVNACVKNLSFLLSTSGWDCKIIRTTGVGRGRKATYALVPIKAD